MRSLAVLLLLAAAAPLGAQSASSWGPARWVWDDPEGARQPQSNTPRLLRLTFTVEKIAAAELWVTADNAYTAYLNGKLVGKGNAWQKVDRYDVAKLLQPGKNVLAVEVVNQGGVAGAIARLRLRNTDGSVRFVVTDRHTRLSTSKQEGWLRPDFDDAAWATAAELGGPGIGPWSLAPGGRGAGSGFDFAAVDPKVKARQKPEDQVRNFIVPEGFEVELVAADPLIINPVTMTVDDRGRIYVSESHTYRYGPNGSPIKPYANPVIRLDADGKGGWKRTLIAEGFSDPAMGLAVRGDKLWVSACHALHTFDLHEDGPATNKQTIVVDGNKAWNPFGMFVLEWGPDGLLYMSVGNHNIALKGSDGGKLTGRGSSGIVLRMQPDGSKMERLVHGLRVPYSFEFDPFGQLWLLSNGEGNPNRFVRVIEGVDYHCYSRTNDGAWLGGRHPLAPPCFELHRGADTQLLRYFGGSFPADYQGSLLVCNWGGHGFPGLNRGIFRFVPDERNAIARKEPFVLCSDPYFRPSHIALDHAGDLLIADWYGRDDESDLTGRIWRVRPKTRRNVATQEADPVAALSSADHVARDRATSILLREGNKHLTALENLAAKGKEPLGAAQALWVLARMGPEGRDRLTAGTRHPDWRVRRLTLDLLRRYEVPGTEAVAGSLARDADPAVRVAAALARSAPDARRDDLLAALRSGAAADPHLRYEAAWHLARHGDLKAFASLLTSVDPDLQAAGLIAVDTACFESLPSRKSALAALGSCLVHPGKTNLDWALDIVKLNPDASLASSLAALVRRDDLPPAQLARTILLMKGKIGGFDRDLAAAVGKRFVARVEKGEAALSSPEDHALYLEFLEFDGPTPAALKHIGRTLAGGPAAVRPQALALARRFGKASAPLVPELWKGVLDAKAPVEARLDFLATIAAAEDGAASPHWRSLLDSKDTLLATDALRWWRRFRGQPLAEALNDGKDTLLKQHPDLADDLETVLRHLHAPAADPAPLPEKERQELGRFVAKAVSATPPPERKRRALLGKQVFERSACVKCHTEVARNTPLAPSLKGIGAQKIDYLVESVLFPSKVIKTGFETEVLVTKKGETLSGIVKDEGNQVRVFNLDRERTVARTDVEVRFLQKLSIMPEGQDRALSRREIVDLVLYLATLK